MSQRFIYMTMANAEQALEIGRSLVEERLAACVNVLGPMRSIYWWQGAVQEDGEVALVAKTRADLVEALTARVRAMHSYAVPCVVALPIEGGNPEFLEWIETETARKSTENR
jgi:periplasmic divalent cation tolerance protein